VGWALLVRLGPVGRVDSEGAGLGGWTVDGGWPPGCVVVGAAQGPGPPLRPQWRCASLARLPVRAALDPGDLCGPWGQGGAGRLGACPGRARRAERQSGSAAVDIGIGGNAGVRWGWVMAVGQVWLAGEDAAELAQMLEFVDDWLGGPDRQLLTDSLARFVGAGGYDLEALRVDVARFVFLLVGQDGERVFGGQDG